MEVKIRKATAAQSRIWKVLGSCNLETDGGDDGPDACFA
jgi:hypothetical protein